MRQSFNKSLQGEYQESLSRNFIIRDLWQSLKEDHIESDSAIFYIETSSGKRLVKKW